jgi:hypothetical protein
MMGERTVAQEALFCSFNLERHVPTDHLLRSIDRFVDLTGSHGRCPKGERLCMGFADKAQLRAHVINAAVTDIELRASSALRTTPATVVPMPRKSGSALIAENMAP